MEIKKCYKYCLIKFFSVFICSFILLLLISFTLSANAIDDENVSNNIDKSDYIKYETNLAFTAYNIQIKHNGKWEQTTFFNEGYETKILIDGMPYDLYNMENGIPKKITSDISVTLNASIINQGRYVKIEYVVENKSNSSHEVSIGCGADVQIGNDMNTPITKFKDGSGFKMSNGKDESSGLNFVCKNAYGVTNVDGFWYGLADYFYTNFFAQVNNDKYIGDSGITYSWKDQTIDEHSSRNFSTIIGVGSFNNAPKIVISNSFEDLEKVKPNATYSFSGSVFDLDNTIGTKVYYSIDSNKPILAYVFKNFPGEFTANINIPSDISIGKHVINFYAMDSHGEFSNIKTYTFVIPKPTYTVSFNTNTGSKVDDIANVEQGSKIIKPNKPIKSGYSFIGWYKDCNFKDEWNFFKDKVTSNITLYAKWKKLTIEIAEVPKQIDNPELISINPDNGAFNECVELKIKYDTSVAKSFENMLKDKLNDKLNDKIIFPLNINVYSKNTNTKVQPNVGKSVQITCPIPENLLAYKDSIKIAYINDGKMQVLDTKIVLVNGIYCIQFSTTHFSPYAIMAEKDKALNLEHAEKTNSEKTQKINSGKIKKTNLKELQKDNSQKSIQKVNVPNTADNANLLSFVLIAIISIITIIVIKNKKK